MSNDLNSIIEQSAQQAARLAATEAVSQLLERHQQPIRPEWLTPESAGLYIGVSPDTLATWRKAKCKESGPPYHRVNGRVVRYRLADLDDWMASRPRAE